RPTGTDERARGALGSRVSGAASDGRGREPQVHRGASRCEPQDRDHIPPASPRKVGSRQQRRAGAVCARAWVAEAELTGRTVANLQEQLQEALAGRYQIVREVGRGGSAIVYLAHDLRHDRQVALKVLHPDLAVTLGPERFQREIRTTAR